MDKKCYNSLSMCKYAIAIAKLRRTVSTIESWGMIISLKFEYHMDKTYCNAPIQNS